MRQASASPIVLALAPLLYLLLGVGCSRAELPARGEAAFAELYPMEKNVRLSIMGPPLPNMEDSCGRLVVGTILNQSSDPIFLPAGNRPELWTYSSHDDAWLPVQDDLIRSPQDGRVVEPRGNDVPFWPLTYLPDVDCSVPSRIIRVVVVGTVMNGETPTGEQTGAFIDIFVDPTTGRWRRVDQIPLPPSA